MQAEFERYKELTERHSARSELYVESSEAQWRSFEAALDALKRQYTSILSSHEKRRQELEAQHAAKLAELKQLQQVMEQETDREITELKAKYDAELRKELTETLELKTTNAVYKNMITQSSKKIAHFATALQDKKQTQEDKYAEIELLTKDIQGMNLGTEVMDPVGSERNACSHQRLVCMVCSFTTAGHKKEIKERDNTINDKLVRIMELQKKNMELEKFKFVLDYKIRELKRQIEPRKKDIAEKEEQLRQMRAEYDGYVQQNEHLKLDVDELRLKESGMEKEIAARTTDKQEVQAQLRRLKTELHEVVASIDDPKALQNGIKRLYQR
jgi:chromosome segregation ATPase